MPPLEKESLQATLDQAVNGALLATKYDRDNYLNFQTLGSVYEGLASFGVGDVYGKIIEAYQIAATLNPNNPKLKLAIAGAYFADGKTKEAKDYGILALSLKPDYIDTLITLSQIAKSEGNSAEAVSYAEKALSISPENKDLIKYIDSLKKSNTSESKNSTSKKP